MKLLFVEDDEIIRSNFRNYLNSIFDSVYEVSDGKLAFPEYERVKPDVILLDISLPSVDGLTIAKRIRKSGSDVSIIILSALDDRDVLLKATELHLTKYLLKPLKRNELQDAMIKVTKEVRYRKNNESIVLLKNSYIWNREKKELCHGNESITLTKKEIHFLESFCLKSNPIITSEEIYYEVYKDSDYNENKVRMLIKRFRSKTYQDILITIYGLGFKFNLE